VTGTSALAVAPGGAELSRRKLSRREQRSADSRTQILDAAVACLIEGGYSGATTLQIQGRAGVSRGRLLHHFPSRDVLLVAAAHHLAAARVGATAAKAESELARQPAGPDRIDRVVELMWETHHEPHYWAAVELWTAARTNDEIATALLQEERRLGGTVRAAVDGMFGAELAAHPRYPLLRDLLLSGMRGAALTYAFDRRDPSSDPHLDQWKILAHRLLEG
jgi:AcrR family transcriptional regulator